MTPFAPQHHKIYFKKDDLKREKVILGGIDPTNDHLIYLASPFTHDNKNVEHHRFIQAEVITALMMKNDYNVFSPIVYSYELHRKFGFSGEFTFWAKYDEVMLKRCTHVVILDVEGWDTSKGVANEIKLANKYNIPILKWSQIVD
jgi:hypothetical protein